MRDRARCLLLSRAHDTMPQLNRLCSWRSCIQFNSLLWMTYLGCFALQQNRKIRSTIQCTSWVYCVMPRFEIHGISHMFMCDWCDHIIAAGSYSIFPYNFLTGIIYSSVSDHYAGHFCHAWRQLTNQSTNNAFFQFWLIVGSNYTFIGIITLIIYYDA